MLPPAWHAGWRIKTRGAQLARAHGHLLALGQMLGCPALIEIKAATRWLPIALVGLTDEKRGRNEMGRNPIFSIMMLIATLALAGRTGVAQTAPSERGHTLAQNLCAGCHAIGREGPSPISIAPPFRDLSQRYPIEMLAEALAEGMMTGHPAMPNFTLHPRDIDALLGYIDGLSPLH